ncbi:YfhO family protein [Limosilactobacillus fastidiosus]|uniref:YfhO family protein n=1 Tax=Limosilactobacillus fastidiosus TaxID=2759855 RepID=A0ABR6E6J3_9LACO|nr:YfhO family protein [Limosilactobacillus fastidiosus]MBB1062810.1 YfhO family protein [Limosilactobacillus fastidiosus]MCD7084032.1 YfhO family protein [Limosilactobacillus fastidiosus]
MDFSFKKRSVKKLYLEYTVLFLFLALCIFGTYLITGHSFIWSKDALNQHLPLLAKYREAVINFFHHPGTLNFWSWQFGIGSDTFQVFSYYNIGDVFSYLALLFPAHKITRAYQFISIVRMYCVGLAFVYFAQHFKFRNTTILAGTTAYLVNSFLLYACVAQPFFTTPFILFPLIVVQIERILQGGSAWPLAGAFTWMLISNYYLAFILGIGSLIYLILRVTTKYRKTLSYLHALIKLAFATITSLLLSAIMWIPELIAVRHSTRLGAQFANGLKVYPLYYYLFLPKQLINGDQWSFMFWSALGIVSIGFIALVYVYIHAKKYPLITISLGLALLMLLIPAVGATFNGMMAASNRWTLLIYLPLSTAICLLVENAHCISHHSLKIISFATGIYVAILLLTFLFENENDIVIPLLFLLTSLLLLWLISFHRLTHPQLWLLSIIVLNAGFNAIYASFPYNGDFSTKMLSRGQYQRMMAMRYGGLDQGLDRTPSYRVSTISENQIIDVPTIDNDLTSGLHNIDSYYSLQNQYLGNFSTSLQNNQYQTNVPLRQVDDRTVLNNFLGVKYLFVQSNGENATKIPEGYLLDQSSQPIINYDSGQPSDIQDKKDFIPTQTNRYKTNNEFPLIYWQGSYISQKRYQKLSPTEKERALASGVVVNQEKVTKGMEQANLDNHVYQLRSNLISNRLNKVNPKHLKYTDSEEKYYIELPQLTNSTLRRKLRGSELHIEFSQIKFTPFSMKEQIKYEQQHLQQMATNPGSIVNYKYNQYRYWRYHILNGSPDISFKINVGSRFGTATINQPKQSTLSFFKQVKKTTLNIGYYNGGLPDKLSFQPTKLGTYRLKYQVVAEKLDNHYHKQVATIQQHRLRKLKFSPNKVQGTISTNKKGILTSSIPYSSGWHASVNGKTVKTVRTNQAFLGIPLSAGTHRITFNYQLPGFRTGIVISIIGLIWTILAAILSLIFNKNK